MISHKQQLNKPSWQQQLKSMKDKLADTTHAQEPPPIAAQVAGQQGRLLWAGYSTNTPIGPGNLQDPPLPQIHQPPCNLSGFLRHRIHQPWLDQEQFPKTEKPPAQIGPRAALWNTESASSN